MQVLPHIFIRQRVDLGSNPVVGYSLIGFGVALTFVLLMAVIGLLMVAVAKVQGDMSGVGGVVGFMLVPIIMLTGVPWSLVALQSGSNVIFVIAALVGPLINGAV